MHHAQSSQRKGDAVAQGKSGDGPDNVSAAAANEQQCEQKHNMVESTEDVAKSQPQVGFKSIVVSNQPDVERGLMTLEKLEIINDLLKDELLIEHIEFCTSSDDDNHDRKPNP